MFITGVVTACMKCWFCTRDARIIIFSTFFVCGWVSGVRQVYVRFRTGVRQVQAFMVRDVIKDIAHLLFDVSGCVVC